VTLSYGQVGYDLQTFNYDFSVQEQEHFYETSSWKVSLDTVGVDPVVYFSFSSFLTASGTYEFYRNPSLGANLSVTARTLRPATDQVDASGVLPLILRSAVPEPATWAMMVIGFGAVGSAIRRRRVAFA
jgi:hypothetical protein